MDTNDKDTTKETIAALNDLIATCKDGINGFTSAANAVQDPTIKTQFVSRVASIEQASADLQAAVRRLGGDPTDSGHASAALHRGWINMKAAVSGHDERLIVDEAVRGEEVAVTHYRDALEQPLPEVIRAMVERQLLGAVQNLAAVRALVPLATARAASASASSTRREPPPERPDARL
jgi:uncharacterized protein (TIGR02284 family)